MKIDTIKRRVAALSRTGRDARICGAAAHIVIYDPATGEQLTPPCPHALSKAVLVMLPENGRNIKTSNDD